MIIVDFDKELKKIAPEKKIKRMLTKGLSLKRAALDLVSDAKFLDKDKILTTAQKVIKGYKDRIKDDSEDKKLIQKDPKQFIKRVENQIVYQISQEIGSKYAGEKFEWLPSEASEPDPEHALRYGKIYTIGEIDLPGDRYGCRCAMRILTEDEVLNL
jgi:ribosomal protein S17E